MDQLPPNASQKERVPSTKLFVDNDTTLLKEGNVGIRRSVLSILKSSDSTINSDPTTSAGSQI